MNDDILNIEPVAWTDHIGGFVDYGDDPNYPHPLYSYETVMDLTYKMIEQKLEIRRLKRELNVS